MKASGVLTKIYKNERGNNVSWSLMVDTPKAGVTRFGTLKEPRCNPGDTIEFEFKERVVGDRTYYNVQSDIKVLNKAPVNSDGLTKPQVAEAVKQESIKFQHAQKVAVEILALALEHDCLTLGSKKSDRLDALMGQFHDVAHDIYDDIDAYLTKEKDDGGVDSEDSAEGGDEGEEEEAVEPENPFS